MFDRRRIIIVALVVLALAAVNLPEKKSQAAEDYVTVEKKYPEAQTSLAVDVCSLDEVVCPEEASLQDIIRRTAGERASGLSVKQQIRLYAGTHSRLALAVAFCESSYLPNVRGLVDPRDRGVFQINSRWNPEVSDECAFDVKCATEWFVDEVEAGRLWKWRNSQHCWG